MRCFIKFYSLFIILLFFPISIYFNTIPLSLSSSNLENNSQILYVNIDIYSKRYEWFANITIHTVLNATNIVWSFLYRRGNTLHAYVSIKFEETPNYGKLKESGCNYEIKDNYIEFRLRYLLESLEEGNYSFILHLNGKQYIKNFTIREEEIPFLAKIAPKIFWNGEEWIARIEIYSNKFMEVKDWGEPKLDLNEKLFMINISIEGWNDETALLMEYRHIYYNLNKTFVEYNYSLGILPEGRYLFNIYINYNLAHTEVFSVSKILAIPITMTFTTTETRTIKELNETLTLTYPVEHTTTTHITIKVKEKSEITTQTTSIIEKTTQEIPKKEKFDFEKYSIPTSLFIIVIIVTFLLYYILFKRKEI